MNPKKKIILLGAGFTTRNMGVWALASGAITSALHACPDAQIYLLDYHLLPLKHDVIYPNGTVTVELLNIRFSKKFWLQNNIARLMITALFLRAIPFRQLRNRLIRRNSWLRHIQATDIFGSISGGDSFSDIYGIWRLIYVVLPQILVLLLGKDLVLLPQTIGPFKTGLGKAIARYILKGSKKIYSRDHEGFETVCELIVKGSDQLEFCYDMGFVLEPRIGAEKKPRWLGAFEQNISLVGLNISGLLYIGGYTGKNMFGLKTDYRRLVFDIINYFIDEQGARILLVPHVFGATDNKESDIAACRDIYRKLDKRVQPQLNMIEEGYDHHEIKALIGHCNFFIGSRMHACIAALSQCIPAVGLAYSRKFRGVFASIEMHELVADLREDDHRTVLKHIDWCYRHRIEIGSKLHEKMPLVRDSVLNLFTKLDI